MAKRLKRKLFKINIGGLAHLARALAWQARGDRFESGILHKTNERSLGMYLPSDLLFYCNLISTKIVL
jgi:hypothetical protein